MFNKRAFNCLLFSFDGPRGLIVYGANLAVKIYLCQRHGHAAAGLC